MGQYSALQTKVVNHTPGNEILKDLVTTITVMVIGCIEDIITPGKCTAMRSKAVATTHESVHIQI